MRGAPLTRAELIAKVLPIEKRFFAVATRSVNGPAADVFTPARYSCTMPTSSPSSTKTAWRPQAMAPSGALRAAVHWRAIMFGTRTEAGELAVARLLTVTRTCQLQQLSVSHI
jgi:hypothetical protein